MGHGQTVIQLFYYVCKGEPEEVCEIEEVGGGGGGVRDR